MSFLDLDSEALKGFEKIGIAFSGGLDSSVILQLLSESSIPNKDITALHINHGLSKDSDKWESFCAERASKLDISFKSWKLESLDKISEDSLRIKRLEAFGKWSRENDLIITGHHLDDQIETVLFRIFRGTGIKGLSGIKEFSRVNNINFYRPLLKSTKEELFIQAGIALGFSKLRLLIHHILPILIAPLIVISTANFASAILMESGLSFLGIGAQPPMPSWGGMVKDHFRYLLLGKPYLAILPGFAIMSLVLAFMMLGNSLRDALDVRS